MLGFYDIFYSCCLALLSKWLLPNFPTSRTPQKPIIRTKWVDLIVRFCVCKLSNRIFEQYLKIFVEHKSFGNDIRVDLNSLSNASPNGAK